MPTVYSDLFNDQPAATSKRAGYFSQPGQQDTSLQYAMAQLDATGDTPVTNDLWVMIPISSNDRIVELMFSCDNQNNAVTAWTINCGIWQLNSDGSVGAEVDDELFESALSIDASAQNRSDFFTGNTLTNPRRGMYAWELANLGAATYTEDPNEQWVICVEMNSITGGITTVSALNTLELYYTNA